MQDNKNRDKALLSLLNLAGTRAAFGHFDIMVKLPVNFLPQCKKSSRVDWEVRIFFYFVMFARALVTYHLRRFITCHDRLSLSIPFFDKKEHPIFLQRP